MNVWAWIAVGAAGALVVSASVGIAIAAILGSISRDVSDLLEAEAWALAPPPRANETPLLSL